MLKLTVAVLAFALVGSASAEGWRLDAGSHRAFKQSRQAAKDELSPENIQLLGGALKHIWYEGAKAAEAQQRRYADNDYLRQLDGLSYEEIVHFTDATYEAALRYSATSAAAALAGPSNGRAALAAPSHASRPWNPPYRHPDNRFTPRWSHDRYEPHGGTDLTGPGKQ